MRFRSFPWLMTFVGLILLIGCGGKGEGGGPAISTRDGVKSGFVRSLLGLAQTGVVSGTGGSTGGTSGGVVLFGNLGGFVRNSGASGGSGGSGATGSTGGTGGTDGGGGTTIYFNDYLQLWSESTYSPTESVTLLFEDLAKTKPAGMFRSTFGPDPSAYVSEFQVLAGPIAGAEGRYVSETLLDGTWSTTYRNQWPSFGLSIGQATWHDVRGGAWQDRQDLADGTWFQSSGTYEPAGSGTSVGSDSRGFQYALTYRADGSGEGRVSGPETGLPCVVRWTVAGVYTITWSDGTVEQFDPWSVPGVTTGGGSGGSGSVGSTG